MLMQIWTSSKGVVYSAEMPLESSLAGGPTQLALFEPTHKPGAFGAFKRFVFRTAIKLAAWANR